MHKRFIAVDVGSSYVKFGLFREETLESVERVEKDRIKLFFRSIGSSWNGFPSAVSSVTPSLHNLMEEQLIQATGAHPRFLRHETIPSVSLLVENPETVGVDRIVNCVAGLRRYDENLVIIDLGTATTIDVVTRKGEFLGGMILPGIDAFKESLFQNTEQLSCYREQILKEASLPQSYLGNNTYSAILAGINGGYYSLLQGSVQKILSEFKEDYRVLATGGGASRLDVSLLVSEVVPNLSLEGIKVAFDLGEGFKRESGSKRE